MFRRTIIACLVLLPAFVPPAAARAATPMPAPFAERLGIPVDRQALAIADLGFALPDAAVNLNAGELAGLAPLPRHQMYLGLVQGNPRVIDVEDRRFPEPVTLLLSKKHYPAEDRHLDVVLWTSPPEGRPAGGTLEIALRDATGRLLARREITEFSPTGWFFSLGFPPELAGRDGAVEATWRDGAGEIGRAAASFSVLAPAGTATAGRVPVRVLNETGATLENAPMTVGIPFPRGALYDETRVRLVDETGREVPLQTRVTARWSRFGAIRWLLCDFTADLAGAPRDFHLEYGPEVSRAYRPPLTAGAAGGLTVVDAGRLRLDNGLWLNLDGRQLRVMEARALAGAFIEHEDGRVYRMPADEPFEIEETGPEKVVLRRTGWYRDEAGSAVFCNFVTRLVIHRDSPVARLFHTWIFTGDGNHDRIRDMGWEFPLAGGLAEPSFLAGYGEPGRWLAGDYLLQHDYNRFEVVAGREPPIDFPGGRAAGAAAFSGPGARFYFGAKDFWQNYPSELEFRAGSFWFHNWPRHNKPPVDERPTPIERAYRLRHLHQGEVLDFRTPDEFVEDPIWSQANQSGRETRWEKGRPETLNAQGIARTEELFLYFTGPNVAPEEAALVLEGLNDESLRAVVDPAWLTASGAFGPIRHRDTENYPEDERVYEAVCHAPARWHERLEFYGMWLHGDSPSDNMDLVSQRVSTNRTLKKNHHGWPYSWIPFARSGDPRLLKYAEAATRHMADANFCHYATREVAESMGEDYWRRQGWWISSLFPWGGPAYSRPRQPELRGISVDCDYLWHSYYLTGFHRGRDVALLWSHLVKDDSAQIWPGRTSTSNMNSYLDMYQATFDPWFLIAAHEIAALHRTVWGGDAPEPGAIETVGHFWKPSDRNFYWFTNDEAHRDVALRIAATWCSPATYGDSWQRLHLSFLEESTAAWYLTGDEYYLARTAAYLDVARTAVFDGAEPDYLRGTSTRSSAGTPLELFTGWYIKQFPLAPAAFHHAGRVPEPIPNPFYQRGAGSEPTEVGGAKFTRTRGPDIVFRKATAAPVPVQLETYWNEETAHEWRVIGPAGETAIEGAWLSNRRAFVGVPEGTPPGNYRLAVTGLHPEGRNLGNLGYASLLVPVTAAGVPEVMVFEREETGTRLGGGALLESQYWFMVPPGVTGFWVEFSHWGAMHAVWNPDGERAWVGHRDGGEQKPGPQRAEITVPPEHAGRLWRVTRPGFNFGIRLDPRIPPYVSVSRAKWFDPTEPVDR